MISGVARIYQPGCKADCALVLEGPQGIGKSTVLRNLSYPWFTDEIAAFGTKDASEQTIGVWGLGTHSQPKPLIFSLRLALSGVRPLILC